MMPRAMASGPSLTAVLAAVALLAAPLHVATAGEPSEPIADPTASAAPAGGPVRAELVIDAVLGDASTVVVDRVRVRGEALLRKREVLPARDGGDPQIRIRIEPIGEEPGYRCEFGAYRNGSVIPSSDGVSLCKLCTEAELVDHVEAAIDRVVPKLPAEPPAPRVTPTPPTTPTRRAPLSSLGKAGIGVAVTGVAATIVGAVVVSRPTQTRDSGVEREQTDFRRPGIAVLGIGLAAMVAGLALVAVDRHRAKRTTGTAVRRPSAAIRF